MRAKPLILLPAFLFIVSWLPSVNASSYYTVNLLVAHDEEWDYVASTRYAYSGETLAVVIIENAFYYFYQSFSITYRIVAYKNWDSADSVTNKDVMFDEVVAETGFYSGMTIAGNRVDVLIAFSDQETIGVYGLADRTLGVVLVMETYPSGVGQATENVLQHELSHLYGAPDEYQNGHVCVMNNYPYWIDFPYYYYVPTALVTNAWCSTASNIILSNRGAWGSVINVVGGSCGGTVWWLAKWMMAW